MCVFCGTAVVSLGNIASARQAFVGFTVVKVICAERACATATTTAAAMTAVGWFDDNIVPGT